jgi:hypothetical protein
VGVVPEEEDASDVGLGVAVIFGVGFLVGAGLTVEDGAGVADGDASVVGVGVIKVIFIAASSGIGETTPFLEITAPTVITTTNIIPTMIAIAATVFCLSFIPRV